MPKYLLKIQDKFLYPLNLFNMKKMKFLQENFVTELLLFFLFFVIASLIYFPVFKFGFFQDDFVWISHAKEVWSGQRPFFTLRISNFLMPVIYGYFAIVYKLFGLHAIGYYLANILIHTLNTILVYKISKKILPGNIALVCAIVFLTLRYPMEAVTWISAITALIVTHLLLVAAYYWIMYLESQKKFYYFLTIMFTTILICTKEWSVLLPPFLILVSFLYLHATGKINRFVNSVKKMIPIFGLFAVYLFVQFFLQNNAAGVVEKGFYKIGWHAIPNMFGNILLTFVPLTTTAYSYAQFWIGLSIFALIAMCVAGIILWTKYKNPAGLGIVWMIVAFIPTSFFTWDAYVSRYAYIPAIGVALFAGYSVVFLQNVNKNKKIFPALLSLVMVYAITNAFFTNRVLKTHYSPRHIENNLFAEALTHAEPNIDKEKSVFMYDNTPHKGFILPEILHTLADIQPNAVLVLPEAQTCPATEQCLLWDLARKEIQIIK